MSKMLIGIDVSLRSHHVQFMAEDGTSIASFSVSNDQQGADTLIQKMIEQAEKINSQLLQIGMEATSNLGWHLAHYLKEQLDVVHPNYKVKIYVINASKVARFKKGYDSLPKKRIAAG
ncbi:IS110 family transposase [Aneurinibacillus terranovensis]|uniref:IS110 family transposase n=1 Tax=Aneurinibacillus terranovensis TaxID=278991 RepID=UPI0004263C18|nr:IS110 family transposase [Aneurinibacillus terranovensis]